MSTCATCRHTWPTGTDGDHSCTEQLLTALRDSQATAESWEACVRAEHAPSPCGHSSQYAYSRDGVGKVIRCYVCENDTLHTALQQAYVHNQNMHCFQTKGRLNDELNHQTVILREVLKAFPTGSADILSAPATAQPSSIETPASSF